MSQTKADLSNPRSALVHFYSVVNSDEPVFADAALLFDMPKSNERTEAARKLKTMLDAKGLVLDLSKVPSDDNHRDSISKKMEFIPFPTVFAGIKMVRNSNAEWVFSRESSLMIPVLYAEVLPLWIEKLLNNLPDYFHEKYLGLSLWQYSGLISMLVFIFFLHFLFSWFVDKILERSIWQRLHIGREHHELVYSLAKYLSLIVMMWVVGWFIPSLMLTAKITSGLYTIIDLLQTVFILMLVLKAIAILKVYLMLMAAKTPTRMDDQLIPVAMRVLKVLVGGVAAIHILSLFGVNVTALIAGASVGALAVALAAQDTFKNLFGSLMIFMDKPFQIGDFIQYGAVEGTVEEVGFRSTRIRRVDTSVISVPNGNIASDTLTNLGARRFRLVELVIGILYSSSRAQIENYVNELRKIPEQFEYIQQDNYVIYLRNLSSSSIDIFFRVYIEAADLKTELERREQIILAIIRAKEAAGVEFAYPSTSVYLEKTAVTKTLFQPKEI
jgi:MscS family membrane protein